MIAWFMATRLGRWCAAIGAVLLAIFSAWLYGRQTGKHDQQTKDEAANQAANEQAEKKAKQVEEDRAHVDSQVQELPEAPAQTVSHADPSTAAGKLRDDGWVQP